MKVVEMRSLFKLSGVHKKLRSITFSLLTVNLFLAFTAYGEVLIEKSSIWKYLDESNPPAADWAAVGYDDSDWSTGRGKLGYGDGNEETTVDYGSDRHDKFITSYYRQNFTLDDANSIRSLLVNVLRDDGAAVYLNGEEVIRSNLPNGSVDSDTLASRGVGGSDESKYFPFNLEASNLVNGTNVVAVEIHQADKDSSDMGFDLELISSTSGIPTDISRGPYLQMAGHDQITVRWRTSVETDSRVWYGTSVNNLDRRVSSSSAKNDHEITLTGLKPLTRYYYSVGARDDSANGDPDTYFETSPTPGTATPTRIWVIGDSGTASSRAEDVYTAYLERTGDEYTDQWMMLGDNAYRDGTDEEYQEAVFDMFPALLKQTPLWSTLGNHDAKFASSEDESGPYFDIFTFPRHGEIGGVASGTEAYYSYDYGNIHFIVLDSYDSDRTEDGDMLSWLVSDLQNTNADWIISYWHHPPYTRGSHDSDDDRRSIDMRENVLPILEQYGVDLVLSGHSHSYERTMLLDGHYGDSSSFDLSRHTKDDGDGNASGDGVYKKPSPGTPNEGAIYIVAGSSGHVSGDGNLDHPAMSVSLKVLGSVILEIDNLRLNAHFIDDVGSIEDTFTIDKSEPNSKPLVIPGKIEAEDFTYQEGTRAETTKDVGGGQNMGYIQPGDFLKYSTRVAQRGNYVLDLRIATVSNGSVIDLSVSGDLIQSINLPNAGGWQEWSTISADILLAAGEQTLRIGFRSSFGAVANINWMQFSGSDTENIGVINKNDTDFSLAGNNGL